MPCGVVRWCGGRQVDHVRLFQDAMMLALNRIEICAVLFFFLITTFCFLTHVELYILSGLLRKLALATVRLIPFLRLSMCLYFDGATPVLLRRYQHSARTAVVHYC